LNIGDDNHGDTEEARSTRSFNKNFSVELVTFINLTILFFLCALCISVVKNISHTKLNFRYQVVTVLLTNNNITKPVNIKSIKIYRRLYFTDEQLIIIAENAKHQPLKKKQYL